MISAQLRGLQLLLFILSFTCYYVFSTSITWVSAFYWWVPTICFFVAAWCTCGLPRVMTYAFSLLFTAILLQHLQHQQITPYTVAPPLLIAATTIGLVYSKYLADALWSAKTILLDWIISMIMMVVLTCIDLLLDKKTLIILVSYFSAANIFGVAIMKACETLWKMGYNSAQTFEVHFVHNLRASIPTLKSLGVNHLLYCCWVLVYILAQRVLSEPEGVIQLWQLSFVVGLWSTIFVYLIPIAAQPLDAPQRQQS